MMKMKKIVRFFGGALVLASLIVMGGCAQKGSVKDKTEAPDLKIGVAAENEPYYTSDSDGKAEGFYVDLMEAVADKLKCSYIFVEADQENVSELLKNGACDVWLGTALPDAAAGDTWLVTDQSYLSDIYLVTNQKGGIQTCEELRGKDIAARSDGAVSEYAAKTAARYEGSCVTFPEQKEAMEDLRQGQAAAAVIDAEVFRCLPERDLFTVLKISEKSFEDHHFSVLEEEQWNRLQTALEELEEEGTLDSLREQYFSVKE